MSVVFKLRVTGIDQDIAGLNKIDSDIKAAMPQLLDGISRTHQGNLIRFVHIWRPEVPKKGPHMIQTIREERRGPNYVIVTVPTTYAQAENRRPGSKPGHGTHNFVDQAQAKTIPEVSKIWLQTMTEIMERNKVHIVSL